MCSTLNWDTLPPAETRWRRRRGGRSEAPPGSVFLFCFFFFFPPNPRRSVRESYQGFHSRDFAVIFSRGASARGPFRFSGRRASRLKRRLCDCNQRRRASRTMYPPACAAHALSLHVCIVLYASPFIPIYLQYLYQCFVQSWCCCFFLIMNHTNTKES